MSNLRKAFLLIEYVILIAIVVAALIGLSVYLKRAITGKWRSVGDTFGHGRQYYPTVTKCYDSGGNLVPCGRFPIP